MMMIRRSAWTIVMLGAVLGCGTEEAAPPPAIPSPPPGPRGPMGPDVGPMLAPSKEAAPTKEMVPAPSQEEHKPGEPKKTEPPKVEGPKAEGSKSATGAVKLDADELAAIKELPAADQPLAISQAVCPVSNHHLGEMGKPVKVTAEGRTFFLCCEDCQPEVKKDPKAVIAKLDKK